MDFLSNSEQETKDFAKEFAQTFKNKGGIISLTGDLGAGKTTFTQGFAAGLNIKEKVISPTFVLIRHHPIPNSKRTLFHIDLYRLEGTIDIESLGIKDLLMDSENIILIEWAEKIKEKLPENIIKIQIENLSETQRKITITQKE